MNANARGGLFFADERLFPSSVDETTGLLGIRGVESCILYV